MSEVVLAAGAIVWRKHKDKFTEVAIIHRPKYDDWTFPKGKSEVNESLIACAHREVLEETNIHTEFGAYFMNYHSRTPFFSAQAAPADAFAAAVASARIASMSLSSTLVRVTAPEAIDPSVATNEITVTLRCWITPLVVRVLLAQRRLA